MDLVDALIHGISHDRQPVRFDSERICRLICIKANSIQWMKIMRVKSMMALTRRTPHFQPTAHYTK